MSKHKVNSVLEWVYMYGKGGGLALTLRSLSFCREDSKINLTHSKQRAFNLGDNKVPKNDHMTIYGSIICLNRNRV